MWNEGTIARAVALHTLARKCVVLVDRCNWTGHECDVLAVTMDLRVIDVEIKISRADLKADAAKDKWWHRFGSVYQDGKLVARPSVHRDWPPRVWKHYYAMPAEIWDDKLLPTLGSPASGILLLKSQGNGRPPVLTCQRRAKPNRDANKLSEKQALDIARLANLRMWSAYSTLERYMKGEANGRTG